MVTDYVKMERMSPDMIERRKALTLTVVLVFVSSAISFFAGASGWLPHLAYRLIPGQTGTQQPVPGGTAASNYQLLDQVQSFILQNAYEPPTQDKLMEGALQGMVAATGDKYSTYFNAENFKAYREHFIQGSFSGIGVTVEVSQTTGLVTVLAPIKGSPGEKAGLRQGDAITHVDDKDIRGYVLEEAVKLIRGPLGSKVKLTVQREGVKEPMQFVITRDTIQIAPIEARMVDAPAGVGYVLIREFNEGTTERLTAAIKDLQGQGMKRMILDLRQNPGGLLDEAIGVSSLFVPAKQPVVHVVSRSGGKETYESRGKEHFTFPLVVLVDGGSASASEIVSGAVKDTKVGALLGTKTFGKGSVQTFFPLPDGSGLKLTTANYLTAGENAIHGKGIVPDVVVENPKDVVPGEAGDVQLTEAIKYVKTLSR